jgi:hypothetical protein
MGSSREHYSLNDSAGGTDSKSGHVLRSFPRSGRDFQHFCMTRHPRDLRCFSRRSLVGKYLIQKRKDPTGELLHLTLHGSGVERTAANLIGLATHLSDQLFDEFI